MRCGQYPKSIDEHTPAHERARGRVCVVSENRHHERKVATLSQATVYHALLLGNEARKIFTNNKNGRQQQKNEKRNHRLFRSGSSQDRRKFSMFSPVLFPFASDRTTLVGAADEQRAERERDDRADEREPIEARREQIEATRRLGAPHEQIAAAAERGGDDARLEVRRRDEQRTRRAAERARMRRDVQRNERQQRRRRRRRR
jgi:hypothetical protein